MLNQISPIILAILLTVVLAGSATNLIVLAVSQAALILVSFYINYRRFGWYWSHLLLPVFFLIGIGMTYALIPGDTLRLIFLIFLVAGFYFLETHLGKESHLLQNLYLLSVFMIYLGLFALRFYFVDLSFWWILAAIAFMTYFLVIQGFAGVTLPTKRYFVNLAVLVIIQAALGLMLWPTHFFLNAVVLFSIFYLIWLFASSAFFGKLSSNKIYWQLTLVAVVLAVTLSTAAWQPLAR